MKSDDTPRKAFARKISSIFYRPANSVAEDYHHWYYNTGVWRQTRWMGISTLKSPMDMWNYQEILWDLKPALVIEFGTYHGGSALFFAMVIRQMSQKFCVLSVDVDHSPVGSLVERDPDIMLLESLSTAPAVAHAIADLKQRFSGPVFTILDSDHSKQNVLGEMKFLRPYISPGDYMIVEDSNVNGHPVLPMWGDGPHEAIETYFKEFPSDYVQDSRRAFKFGFTFAPNGFLIRQT